MGHSAGEVACGYADGCLSEEQTIAMAYYRGYVCNKDKTINGLMAAIGIGYKDILPMVPPDIDANLHNSRNLCTISGPYESVKKFVEDVTKKGIFARAIDTNNIAFHSRYISSLGPDLIKLLKVVIPNPKKRSEKWISTCFAEDKCRTEVSQYCSAEYSAHNFCNAVLFEEAAELVPPNSILIEIGPHAILSGIIRTCLPESIHVGLTKRGELEGTNYLLNALGK